jgi:hypothetical protein
MKDNKSRRGPVQAVLVAVLVVMVSGAANGGNAGGGLGERAGVLWETLEWSVESPYSAANAFDAEAKVDFVHTDSGQRLRTGMFFAGGTSWRFRFTGTKTGKWVFSTSSEEAALSGLSGSVVIEENSNRAAHGFMKAFGNKWGWRGTEEAFVPQYVMGKDLDYFYDFGRGRVDGAKIDAEIREFMVEHGFTGFHLQVRGRWFDIRGKFGGKVNPDLRTYEVLEAVIGKVHSRGGACHLWMWGKDQRRGGDGPRSVVGGVMNEADRRNLRYLAARLGPLPGWSIGYGYDTENLWASPDELTNWKEYIEGHSGWDHFIGARVGFDEKGTYGRYGKGIPKAPLNEKYNAPVGDEYMAWLGGDYSGYTSYRPLYDRYVEILEHRAEKPSFDEDRFRIRDAKQWTHKDYDAELTIKGLWHSAMAGGAANIWGNLLPRSDEGGSQSYDHGDVHIKHLIKTYATFFRDKRRFRRDFMRDNGLADPRAGTTEKPESADISVCLRNPERTHYIFYKENCLSVGMDLRGMAGPRSAIAVDTKESYREVELGRLSQGRHKWRAPYKSDWAIAVGEF